jgi:hypothetical protein
VESRAYCSFILCDSSFIQLDVPGSQSDNSRNCSGGCQSEAKNILARACLSDFINVTTERFTVVNTIGELEQFKSPNVKLLMSEARGPAVVNVPHTDLQYRVRSQAMLMEITDGTMLRIGNAHLPVDLETMS